MAEERIANSSDGIFRSRAKGSFERMLLRECPLSGLGTACQSMDLQEYVETRRRRYLAQALGPFDEHVQPLLDQLMDVAEVSSEARLELEGQLESFKRELRRSFRNFASDVSDTVGDVQSPHINGYATQLRDRVSR